MATEEVINQCIFCQMALGKTSSFKVYEDEECVAVLDIKPANLGHLLLLPKEHYSILPQTPPPLIEHLSLITQKLSKAILSGLGAKGTNILIANGAAAGQRAQHLMIHIIPRLENDNLALLIPQKDHDRAQLEKTHSQLLEKMRVLTGRTKNEASEPPPKPPEGVDLDAIGKLFGGSS